MYKVSKEYSEQIKKPLRALSYIKVKFGLVSPDAVSDAEITSISPKLPFAENPELTDDKEVTSLYSTLEPNLWLLDGSLDIVPDTGDTMYQAYVSETLSDLSTAAYEGGIVVTLEFDQDVYAFRGLTFTFDTVQDNYPTEVTVVGYLNGVQNYSYTTNIDSAQFVLEKNIPTSGDFINRLDIVFTKNKLPGRRLRIQDIALGVLKTLTPDSIVESTWDRKNDLMNTVLPTNEFTFSFYDIKNEYNPDNPEGVWGFLEAGQSIAFSYGYELDSGDIEWIPGSTLYTQGTPSIENGGSLPKVTFSATSKLQMLTDVYDEGVYYPGGISLYDLADTLLMWSGVVDSQGNKLYTLHDSLKNYLFRGVVPKQEVKQLLQLIANAGMCVLNVDRRGYIVFQPRATVSSGFKYELTDIMDATPDIKKYPYLKNLYVSVTDYSVASEATEIASVDISDADSTEYTVEFSSATAITISTTSGLTINSTVGVYAQKVVLVLSGTGTLKIQGKNISSATYTVLKNCNLVGEDCTVENIMITSREHAIEYLNWMSEVLQMRNVYSFNDRGFPEIDESDIVALDTHFTDNRQGVVTGSTIKYNGALSGTTEVLS